MIFRAHILNPLADDLCLSFPDGYLSVNDSGQIESLGSFEQRPSGQIQELRNQEGLLTIIPGFCDLHFHWVQDKVRTAGKDNLLDWLSAYVFPEESRFADQEYAALCARQFFPDLASKGTLYGSAYASIHQESIEEAMPLRIGHLRIGNPVMTAHSPQELCRDTAWFKQKIEDFVQIYGQDYVITPRFALSCKGEDLQMLGHMAKKHDLYVQTHLSETKEEIRLTLEYYKQFPDFKEAQTYLDIYNLAGLVGPKSIFGHCIHLEDREWKLLKSSGSHIAHCPTSNAPISCLGLGSGCMDLDRVRQEQISWALASDIGAGPITCMLDVMQMFLQEHRRHKRKVSAIESLFRATVAGTRILGTAGGEFKAGFPANFVCLPPAVSKTAEIYLEDLLQTPRWDLHTHILDVYFKGQPIPAKL